MGLGFAFLLTQFLSGLLFGVKPLDLFTFAAVSFVLPLVAMLAGLLPAWRAYRLDPVETLRATSGTSDTGDPSQSLRIPRRPDSK